MTGEITLTGDVLPIGGLLEKVLAAHRVGISRVIIPAANEVDLEDIPDEVREAIEFVPVGHVDEVWDTIFPACWTDPSAVRLGHAASRLGRAQDHQLLDAPLLPQGEGGVLHAARCPARRLAHPVHRFRRPERCAVSRAAADGHPPPLPRLQDGFPGAGKTRAADRAQRSGAAVHDLQGRAAQSLASGLRLACCASWARATTTWPWSCPMTPQPRLELAALASGAALRFGPSHTGCLARHQLRTALRPPTTGYLRRPPATGRALPRASTRTRLKPRWPLPMDKLRQMAQQVHFHKPNPDQMLIGVDPGPGQDRARLRPGEPAVPGAAADQPAGLQGPAPGRSRPTGDRLAQVRDPAVRGAGRPEPRHPAGNGPAAGPVRSASCPATPISSTSPWRWACRRSGCSPRPKAPVDAARPSAGPGHPRDQGGEGRHRNPDGGRRGGDRRTDDHRLHGDLRPAPPRPATSPEPAGGGDGLPTRRRTMADPGPAAGSPLPILVWRPTGWATW